METARARRDAEAAKYRLQVRLGLIAQKAHADKAADTLARAEALRRQVDGLALPDDVAGLTEAQAVLAALEPQVLGLQRLAGVEEYGLPLFPKWLKFLSWTAPVVVLMGVLAFILERRRRRSSPDAAAIEALDAAQGED